MLVTGFSKNLAFNIFTANAGHCKSVQTSSVDKKLKAITQKPCFALQSTTPGHHTSSHDSDYLSGYNSVL